MTTMLTYAHALSASDAQRLRERLQARGNPAPSEPTEHSTPGLLLLGDPTQALQWQRLGHSVIVCGSGGAYSIDEAAALLASLDGPACESFSFGPLLDPLIADPAVSDVLVNGTSIWVDRGAGLSLSPQSFDSVDATRRVAVRIAAYCGRRLDEASPIVDAALPSGIRLHAVLPPVAIGGPLISLRVPSLTRLRLEDMCVGQSAVLLGSVLPALIHRRANGLISGATGTGKTTLLSSLLSLISHDQRLICIEEVAELHPDHPHVVHLQERAANVQGAGGVSLSELVRAAVRMRPDRIIVGECRGAEVRDMLSALNTGHEGGWATIHANSVEEVPARLQALGVLAGLSPQALATQARAAFDVIIHMQRAESGQRRIAQIGLVVGEGGQMSCELALSIDEGGRCQRGPHWEGLEALIADDDGYRALRWRQ